ncbi:MAG: hypothetical protein H0W39_06315 [Sphingomonas sp.]|nr:hypothetical protein [Sphingomonas sp.]
MANPTNQELISIWSKAVDTQMHFNEMSVRSRQLGLTFVTAALALAVVLITQQNEFALTFVTGWGSFKLHLAVLLIAAAAAGLLAVRRLDLSVYHRMLIGAVEFGEDFEEQYMKKHVFILDKGMTQTISLYSRYSDAGYNEQGGKRAYHGSERYSAGEKLKGFYNGVLISLIGAAIFVLIVTNLAEPSNSNPITTSGSTEQVQNAA